MTHTACPTACRGPGMVNGVAMIEVMLEHAAAELGMSSLDLRMENMLESGDAIMPPPDTFDEINPVPQMVQEILSSSDYNNRSSAIQEFNSRNKWKKRGLSLIPMRYHHDLSTWAGLKMNCIISIYGGDGSVSVSQLGIDVSLIRIKHVNNLTSPNGATTGGSAGSETNQVAAIHCCDILNERLQPIKDELGPGATWQEIISAANDKYIDLCERYMFEANKNNS